MKIRQESRQVTRRALFVGAVLRVNDRNLVRVGKSHFRGLPRKQRRALAKAYAAGAWREQRLARLAEAAHV